MECDVTDFILGYFFLNYREYFRLFVFVFTIEEVSKLEGEVLIIVSNSEQRVKVFLINYR